MSAGKFIAGFIVGGAVGAVIGILLAPQSGEETRAAIGKTTKEEKWQVHIPQDFKNHIDNNTLYFRTKSAHNYTLPLGKSTNYTHHDFTFCI